jgi:hypothetical protein
MNALWDELATQQVLVRESETGTIPYGKAVSH